MAANASAGMGTVALQNNYPVQKNGMWMSIASIVGSVAGRAFNSGVLDKAKDAENVWRGMADVLKDKGIQVMGESDVPRQWADDILQQLYNFAKTGYCPDYLNILNNAVQAAAIQFDAQIGGMKRQAGRFNTGLNANVELEHRMQQSAAIVLAYSTTAESARQFMWSANYDMLHGTAEEIEKIKNDRIQLGSDLIASTGQNYANIAQSFRQTAAMDAGDIAMFTSLLGTLIPMFLSSDGLSDLFGGLL